MRKFCLCGLLFVLAIAGPFPSSARSGEPYEKFLAGLRERRLFDYALIYLDTLAADPHCPPEIKAVVPFEKAATLLVMARGESITNPDVQTRQLDQALGFLDEFIKGNASHPRAAEANTERAKILLGKGRIEVWQSRSPANQEQRGRFQTAARDLITKARAIFQTAHDQHKTAWEAFPKFIDMNEDRAQYEARGQAETKYILAQLDLANCTYEEAQTYDKESAEWRAKLTSAATEYEEIHKRYRSQLGGLYARTWQGKCYEEQGDIVRALGIYKELLGHPGQSDSMIRLQDQVRHFELICLNHPSRKDHQLVVDKATEWLADAKGGRKFSQQSLGIRWEQALAWEALASARELTQDNRNRLLNQAISAVRTVKRYPGELQNLATFKERDLTVQLKGAGAADEPQDFDTAFSLASELVTKKTKELLDQLQAAKSSGKKEQIQQVEQELKTHLEQTTGLLKIALRTADEKTPINDLNRARYFLAYVHMLSRNNYEAAILAQYVAQYYGKDNPVQAQDAAYMAMAAFVQAFNDAEKAGRRTELDVAVAQMTGMADYLVKQWPTSDRAMDARLQMAAVSGQLKKHDESAKWYVQIPDSSPRYTDSQTRAGQAYWAAYIDAVSLPVGQQPAKDVLDGWMKSAQQHLQTGIDRLEKETPATTPAPDNLTAAKVSLVQIMIASGRYQDGVNLLTKDPHSVIGAIQVEDETKRPTAENAVKGVRFASLTWQLLLRCHVGTNNLAEARKAMQMLEKIGGGGGEQLTEVFKQLGQELEKELKRLKDAGQTEQFESVRKSFETFLDDISKRQDQTVNSLTWIGETWFGLANSSSGDATKYFDAAAAAYQNILDRAKQDPKFIEAARLNGVRLRQVACRRAQGRFDDAINLVVEFLAQNPDFLDGQVEAAMTFQAWGSSGQPDSVKHLNTAIRGDGARKLWGWLGIGQRLQRLLESGRPDAKAKYESPLYEAWYNIPRCTLEMAKAESGAKRKSFLDKAKGELYSFVSITVPFRDDWWPKFDALYQEIQKEQGVIVPVALERPKEAVPVEAAPVKVASTGTPKKTSAKKAAAPAAAKADEGSGTMSLILFGVVALAGIGGGGFMVMRAGRKTKKKSVGLADTISLPPAGSVSASAPKKARSAAAPTATSSGSAASAESEAKPKRPLTAEEKERLLKQKAAKERAAQAQPAPPKKPPPEAQ